MNALTSGFERQLLKNRRLLWTFVGREMRSRYAGSALGVFWSIIHPLIMLCLYIVVFSTLVKGGNFPVRGKIAGYTLTLCPALLAWNWLSETILSACTSVTNNSALIKKTVFPCAVLPLSTVLSGLLPFAVAMVIFLVFAATQHAFHPVILLYLPAVVVLQVGLLVGPAYLLSAFNVFVRDTAQVVMAVMQFLFWGTPIVYPEETLTNMFPSTSLWFRINPAAHLISAYRDVINNHSAPAVGSVLYLAVLALASYQAGRFIFVRSRRYFPDEV